MDLILSTTSRGFAIATFIDRYGEPCSIRKSGLAGEDCIWLGRDVAAFGAAGARMHLTQEMVEKLIPLLKRFVETGELL